MTMTYTVIGNPAVHPEPGGPLDNLSWDDPPDPAAVAASVQFHRIFDASPGLRSVIAGTVTVVIEVPSASWVDPVSDAFLALARPATVAGPDDDDNGTVVYEPQRWLEFRRDGTDKKVRRPDQGDTSVAAALVSGQSVLGVSPLPDRLLPRAVIRTADVRIVVPPLDVSAITTVAAILTGEPPTKSPLEAQCRVLDAEDMRLARRPGQSADDYLSRLEVLVAPRVTKPDLCLAHLSGLDEAVTWGEALARDITDYRRGALPWAAVDRGALLWGPPGTGKTIFAQALAGTCDLPLITGSLARWQAAGHLGDLLGAMAKTFDLARVSAPCILFIDEVDAVGDRAHFSDQHRDYSVQVVNALLEELDGTISREGVVVVGACNNPGRLDPALVRAGRLDRVIAVHPPDQSALASIFRFHLAPDLQEADLTEVAFRAVGATGADVEHLVRGARRRARHQHRSLVVDDLLAEIAGGVGARTPEVTRRCAVHEAGHALVVALARPGSLVRVSIRPDTSGGGITEFAKPGGPLTRAHLAMYLHHFLAGRAAEEVLLGEPSGGAGGSDTSDLALATGIAAVAIFACGFGDADDRLLWRGLPTPETLSATLAMNPGLAQRVADVLSAAYDDTKSIIRRHQRAVDRLAEKLVERESLSGTEVETELKLVQTVPQEADTEQECPLHLTDGDGRQFPPSV